MSPGCLLLGFLGVAFVSAQTVTLDPTISYNVKHIEVNRGKVSGCSPLDNMLSNQGCDNTVQDLWFQDDGTNNHRYRFVHVPQTTNTFNIISGLLGAYFYLGCQTCDGQNTTDLYTVGDGSGRQRSILAPVTGVANTYTIKVAAMMAQVYSNGLSLPWLALGDPCHPDNPPFQQGQSVESLLPPLSGLCSGACCSTSFLGADAVPDKALGNLISLADLLHRL
ncbi:hypothetical protein C8R44DRAFT_865028 [Mycena epipterygia]|nr:hypothetical protein C8R44DRAFT_865028 [Mycena epipterygia]